MKLYYIRTGPLKVNSYFLVDETGKEAVLIDGGENYNSIKKVERDNGFTVKYHFLTHAHFDHAGAAKRLQDDGIQTFISKIEEPKLFNKDNLAGDFGRKFESFTPDKTFEDGDAFDFGWIKIKCIMTPGHTDGSATFLVDDMLFTGDTLFSGCVGRTDFPTGSYSDMVASVQKLFALDGDYKVYPGHDDFTTLDRERKYNPLTDYE